MSCGSVPTQYGTTSSNGTVPGSENGQTIRSTSAGQLVRDCSSHASMFTESLPHRYEFHFATLYFGQLIAVFATE